MSESLSIDERDYYLEAMKAAKTGSAVLKTRLALVKSQIADKFVFVFEGDDDKTVYANWFKKCATNLSYANYEPFPCGGKYFVLQLKQVIDRDLNDIGVGVYFFVDRDFDDLQDLVIDETIFMTDFYSIENYIVTREVLESVLVNEVQCHGEPEIRDRVVALFEEVYQQFLTLTREHNNRLFLARQLKIKAEIVGNVNRLASVQLSDVTNCNFSLTQAIELEREATPEEVATLQPIFEQLDGRIRYRGKFALLFFMKWLQHVCGDRNSPESKLFAEVRNGCEIKAKVPNFDSLAAYANLPTGLCEFLRNIKPIAPCAI